MKEEAGEHEVGMFLEWEVACLTGGFRHMWNVSGSWGYESKLDQSKERLDCQLSTQRD